MKITIEQRDKLAALYASGRKDRAKELAVEWGCSPKYPGQLSSMRGHGPVYRKYPLNKHSENSHLWQRAIAVGPVIA